MDENIHKKTIYVPAAELDELNELLKRPADVKRMEADGYSDNCVVRVFTAKFGDGIVADIKVYALEGAFFADACLFDDENGMSLCEFDAAGYDNIDNTYTFDVGSQHYAATIKRWDIQEGTFVHWFDPDLADDDNDMYARRWKVVAVVKTGDNLTELTLVEVDGNGKPTGSTSDVFALECEPYPVKTEVRIHHAPDGIDEPIAVFPELDWDDDDGKLCRAVSVRGVECGLFRSNLSEKPLSEDKAEIDYMKSVIEKKYGWAVEVTNPSV